jgi:hypothetical protein
MALSTFISADRKSSEVIVYKSLPQLFLLVFLLAVTFRVFLASILFNVELLFETLLEGIVFIYVAYRIAKRAIQRDWSFNSMEIYLGILFLFPILPALAAIKEFDQPFLYGLATYRDFYLLFGGMIIYNMLREGDLDIKVVEYAFVALAIIFMIFSYFLTAFIDPRQFQDTAISGSNTAKGADVYYRLNMSLFFFGSMYFTVKSFYEKKLFYLAVAGLFIFYVVFIRLDRTSIAVLLGGLALFFTTGLRPRNQVLAILQALIPVAFIGMCVYLFVPQVFTQYYGMFMDVLDTAGAAGSGSVEDDVRLMELDIAIRGIKENPLFGHGKVSTYFKEEGYSHFYGFFYTSDLGFFGYLFSSGIVGLIIIFAQLYFFFKYIFSIKHIKDNVFLVSIKYTVIILVLDGLTTEYLVIYAGQTMTLILLLLYFYQRDRIIGKKIEQEKVLKGPQMQRLESRVL